MMSIRRRIHILVVIVFALGVARGVDAQRMERIRPIDFEQYIQWLDLDDEQGVIAHALYEGYVQSWENEFIPWLEEEGIILPAPFEAGYREALRRNFERVKETLEKFRATDEALFTNLKALLNKEQRPLMQRVRLGRERQLWRPGRGELPEGNVDLVLLLDGLDVAQRERDDLQRFVSAFEPMYVEALIASRRARTDSYKYWHQSQELRARLARDDELDADERSSLLKKRFDLQARGGRRVLTRGQRLVDLNRQALRELRTVLPQDLSDELHLRYLNLAYPEIYPDPAYATSLYDGALVFDSLDEEQVVRLRTAYERFLRKHEVRSREMAESTMRRRAASKLNTAEDEGIMVHEWEELLTLGQERERLNENQLGILRSILTPEQMAQLPEWDFEKNPPPRPWDPWYKPGKPRASNKPAPRDDSDD